MKKTADRSGFEFFPASTERWADVERLFGKQGACGGCWCMFWRVPRKQFDAAKGARNRSAFKKLVDKAPVPPGVLAYCKGEPVGWCAVAPREHYIGLANSRILKPVDDRPVWSISCLFVSRDQRRKGLSAALLSAATDFAASHGARIVEGYPVEPNARMADAFLWHGVASSFRAAGFKEVLRRSETRPVMRFEVTNASRFSAAERH